MLKTVTRIGLPLAAALACAAAGAAGFPEKAITLVVPYPPGGATDTVARVVAKGMGQRLAAQQ